MITDATVMGQEVTNSSLFHVTPDNMGVCMRQHFNNLAFRSPLIIMARLSYQDLITIEDAIHLSTREEKVVTTLRRRSKTVAISMTNDFAFHQVHLLR